MFDDLRRQAKADQNLAELRDAIAEAVPMLTHIAKLNYEYYKALKDAGFSDEQAIKLVQTQGTNLKGN